MRNMIITGGGFVNKGAQAMTYITIAELHRRYPDHRIYLYTAESVRRADLEPMRDYVSVLQWHPLKFARAQSRFALKTACRVLNRNEYRQTVGVYRNCDLMIDISGYSLSSDWSDKICNDYLDNFEYAAAFQIPLVLMPQSFGPFDYPHDSAVYRRASALLPYARVICAREQRGYDALTREFGLTNVILKPDLVLNSRIDLHSVFPVEGELPAVKPDSVGIIPNMNVVSYLGQEETVSAYVKLIGRLLEQGHAVCLMSHSDYDTEICRAVKDAFADNENVSLIGRDLSCIEFSEIVKQFRFCIASRFHSIVHSYKNGIPCVALGWADKYYELMRLFSQESYEFDVRKPVPIEDILDGIDRMHRNLDSEKALINERLHAIQVENVFDILPETL